MGSNLSLANVRLVALEGHSVGHVERLITMYAFKWMSIKYGIFNTA